MYYIVITTAFVLLLAPEFVIGIYWYYSCICLIIMIAIPMIHLVIISHHFANFAYQTMSDGIFLQISRWKVANQQLLRGLHAQHGVPSARDWMYML